MSPSSPVRVAIVNDYEVVVRGVHAMLAPFDDRIEVVELDANVSVAQPVDVTLYDSFGQSWADPSAIDEVIGNPLSGSVAVYTWNMHPALVETSLAKGCRGYLDKSLDAEWLVGAIERIAAGEVVVAPSRVPTTEEKLVGGRWPGQEEGLSPRESEILTLITHGLTNAEIARWTFLSINSVKTYIRNAYRKIGVTRRSQAVRWGLENHMTPDVLRDTDPDGTQAGT